MRFFQQYKFVLLFCALLVFCSWMVIFQMQRREDRHAELRDSFILLHARGYTNESARLYQRLLMELPKLSNKELMEDFQRTLNLVDPFSMQTNNLIWNYHWTISNELDRRSEGSLRRARKLAEEK